MSALQHEVGWAPAGAFVGRHQELAELRAGLADAAVGRGALYLLVGEPGIGKTRLADEFSAEVQAGGALVLWGRSWQGGGAPAYWPWVQVVRSYLRQRDPQSLRAELGEGAAFVAQIAPELREIVPELPAIPRLEPEHLRFALFDAMSMFLRSAARDTPLTLVLDDLHAADTASLLLLRFLARDLRESRLLVIGSYRAAEPRHDREIGAVLGELARDARRVPLRGLGQEDVLMLLQRSGARAPHTSLARAVHQATDGNPFFVDEVVRLLRAEARLDAAVAPGEPLGIPDGVRLAIDQRLDAVSRQARHVLDVAAVIGRDFEARLVAQIVGCSGNEVLEALDEAVDAQLIDEAFRALGRYSFLHALVRETLYDGLPAARRAQLHRDVGEALEHIHGEQLDAHVAQLAHHFFEAAAVGGAAKALQLSALAGDRAMQVLAYEEAAGHYERALGSMQLAGVSDDRRRCELLLRLAEAWRRTGESTVARRTFQQAAAIARRLRAPELLADAAIGYARGLGGFLHVVRADETIIALLEEALGALDDSDSALRVRLLGRLAVELYYSDELERRIALSREAIDIARRLGDRGALVVALYSRHWAAYGPDTLDERLANATEMVKLANEGGDREMSFHGHHVRLSCLLERCEIEPVDRELEAMIALTAGLRQPVYSWRTTCLRAMRAILDARFDEAERLADEAFAIGREASGQEIATLVYEAAQMFALRYGQGRLAEVEEAAVDFTRRYPWIQPWRLPLLYSELGREEEARAELERQTSGDVSAFPRDALWIMRIVALSHACALAGDAGRARQLYDLLAAFADRNVSTIADQPCGPVAIRLGMLAATMQRWDDAERHFEAGLVLCRSMRAPTFIALTLLEHARMLRARGAPADRGRMVEFLREAELICRERGINAVLERVVREQARVQQAVPPGYLFHVDGDFWTIAYEGAVFRMKDGKGLHYLARLLANPGVEVHALDLVAAAGGRPRDESITTAAAQAAQEGLRVSRLGGIGAALDAQAKTAYRRRLEELEGEVEQARAFNDRERAATLEQELDALKRELAAAVGLGGRDRDLGSPSERARVNVTRSIRSSIARIEDNSPALARHLTEVVRTGTFCAYLPAPAGRPAWRL